MIFDAIVVGKGLIGTAVTRYLSEAGLTTAVIGPDEPAQPETHTGVFASHYDQGRITRRLSKDEIWTALAIHAINQYAYLEGKSGIQFYAPKGGLYVSNPNEDSAYLQKLTSIAIGNEIRHEVMTASEAAANFTCFAFPAHHRVIYEPAPAGYINPRDLIRAQLHIARQQKATIIRETAVSATPSANGYRVETDHGSQIEAKNVLVAAGAYTNSFSLFPQKLDLKIKTETIILADLPPAEAKRLQNMPTLIYMIESANIDSIYLLPPIMYPDGRVYLKMGCNTRVDRLLASKEEMREWMVEGDSNLVFTELRQALLDILPKLRATSFHTRRCLITYTSHRKPYIDQIGDGLFVATGGNGSSAKSSDTIGKLGAQLITQENWGPDFNRSSFKAEFA